MQPKPRNQNPEPYIKPNYIATILNAVLGAFGLRLEAATTRIPQPENLHKAETPVPNPVRKAIKTLKPPLV